MKAEITSPTSPTIPVIGEILAAVSLSWKDWLIPAQMTFVTPKLLSILNRSSTDKSSKVISALLISLLCSRSTSKTRLHESKTGEILDLNTGMAILFIKTSVAWDGFRVGWWKLPVKMSSKFYPNLRYVFSGFRCQNSTPGCVRPDTLYDPPHNRRWNRSEDVIYRLQNHGKANRRISNIEPQNVEGWFRFAHSFFIK